MSKAMTTTRSDEHAIQALNVGALMQAMIDKGITPESVQVAKDLMALHREIERDQAAKEFAAAFADLQAEMPQVNATRAVPGNDGSVRYTYAPYEDLMREVQPFLSRHGFSVTFDMDFAEGRIVAKCTLVHRGGHSRTNQFAARAGKGPPGTNEAQADGAARSYARRLALCDALNIVVEKDNDARADGEEITADEADELARRVQAVAGANGIGRWLNLAGVTSFDQVRRARYAVVMAELERAEETARRVAVGNASTLAAKRAACLEHFGKMGVVVDRVMASIGKAVVDDITLDDLAKLKGLATAIKEGDTTVDEAFPVAPKPGTEAPKPSGTDALKAKLGVKPATTQEPEGAEQEPTAPASAPVEPTKQAEGTAGSPRDQGQMFNDPKRVRKA